MLVRTGRPTGTPPSTSLRHRTPSSISSTQTRFRARRLDISRKVVALTFDAGSDLGYARQILDALKANGVKASFGGWSERATR